MNALLAYETAFLLALKPWLAEPEQHEIYHAHYTEAGAELNLCDGNFWPAMCLNRED